MSRQLRHQWLSPFLNPSRSKTSRSAAGSSPYRRRLRLERLEERQLLATFTVTNTFDSGLGSLRHLIIAANLSPNTDIDGDGIPEPDRIAFHIPASDPGHVYYREDGVAGQVTLSNVTATTAVNDGAIPNIDPDWPHSWYSIKPASELPTITSRVVMDGYTQPGARANTLAVGKNTVLKVEIDGSSGPVDAVGLHIDSDGGSTVSGLVINRFTRSNNTNPGGHGIQLGGIGGNVVEGNFLGTDISGTTPQGNTRAGVEINSPANLIGGTTPQARNVISGNLQVGISITGVHAIRNIVQGNFIGVDATGTRALGNEFGVFCFSDENIIGGTIAGGRNVISGNDADGIRILGSHNVLQGNFIGTDFTGNVALGNGRGVHVHFGTDNTVGGLSPAARNVISGNIESGIDVERPRIDETPSFSFAQNTLIQGNFIGTTASGAAPLGNGAFGILVTSSSNLIGAASGAGGNVISANGRGGIFFWGLSAQDNIVQGNLIGGTTALGNQDFGIKIQAGIHNKVGGEEHGAGNTIAFNVTDGVQVSLDDAKRNAVVGNQIFSNGMVGINLGDRVTPNDPDDSDDGPNNFQNFPEIRHAAVHGNLLVTTYSVPSEPGNSKFPLHVEFFKADGDGEEGQTYLGADKFMLADFAAGERRVTLALAASLAVGDKIVATATDADENTSEFSASRIVVEATPPAPPSVVGVIPASPANNNTATIIGVAEPNLLVKLYTDPQGNSPVAGSGIASSVGFFSIVVSVADNTTTTFYATATDADGIPSDVSTTSVRYVEDSTAPVPPTVSGSNPDSPANNKRPSITGTAEPNSLVRIYTDSKAVSPVAGSGLANHLGAFSIQVSVEADTTTSFYATATDAAGNTSPVSTTFVTYVHDGTPPDTSILSGPPAVSGSSVTFNFASNEPNVTFEYRLDDGAFVAAPNPLVLTGLDGGSHLLLVRARDAAGNVDPTPAVHNWTTAFTVTSTFDSGLGSLRRALSDANLAPGLDYINFDIPTSDPGWNPTTGVFTITPSLHPDWNVNPSSLPHITGPVVIDGYSQPGARVNTASLGNNAELLIELSGELAGFRLVGLFIESSDVTIKGLVMNRFAAAIETKTAPTSDPLIRNAVIEGNFLGVNAAGDEAVAGSGLGVNFTRGTAASTIGGSAPPARNVIAGPGSGIQLYETTGIVIQGNTIGTNADGSASLSAGASRGILIQNSSGSIVRGNLVSGYSSGDGIDIADSSAVQVAGNLIGTDVTGTVAIPNTNAGISIGGVFRISSDITIGGTTGEARNVISGSRSPANNGGAGIIIGNATRITVQGNSIGTDIDGNRGESLGNFYGILAATNTNNNMFGGLAPEAGNTIAYNTASGIVLSGIGHAILSNSIHSNGGLGIDLDHNWVTPNDPGDVDTGANLRQNFPVFTSVRTNGMKTMIRGLLDSTTGASFTLQFFANDMADGSGFGEGQFFLGTALVTPNANKEFTVLLPVGVGLNQLVTSTATDSANNTSEFSAAIGVSPDPPPVVANPIPDQYTDNEYTAFAISFTLDSNTFTDPEGEPLTYTATLADGSPLPSWLSFNSTSRSFLGWPVLGDDDRISIRVTASDRVLSTVSDVFDVILPEVSFVVTNTSNSGFGSLAYAIACSNAHPGLDTITFNMRADDPRHFYYPNDNVPEHVFYYGVGEARFFRRTTAADDAAIADIDPDWPHSWYSIQPDDLPLPPIVDPAIIDGYSQPGAAAATETADAIVRIDLDGSLHRGSARLESGLVVQTSDSTVRGLAIHNFTYGGITLRGNENTIAGNYIGTEVSGTVHLGVLGHVTIGIHLEWGAGNLVGGNTPADRNIISGNLVGVRVDDGPGHVISGNYVGTSRMGRDGVRPFITYRLGNNIGIQVHTSGTRIGGALAGEGNLISDNRDDAIVLAGNDNIVQGNRIGVDLNGKSLPNNGNGVVVFGLAGNAILGNSIYSNAGLGIDLEDNGVTLNDLGDSDAGANLRQNFPVLASVETTGGQTMIHGTLDSMPGASFTLQFFANNAADPSGHGEGQYLLGTATVTPDAAKSFTVVLPVGVLPSQLVTATATDSSNNTSEFSAAADVLVIVVPPIVVDTFADVVDAGDGVVSLREAVIAANATPEFDEIQLSAGTYTLRIEGIDEELAATGDLDIRNGVTIVGAGADQTIIQAGTTGTLGTRFDIGNGIDRVFHVNAPDEPVTFAGVSIRNGRATSGGGGGILASGTYLTIIDSTISNNEARNGGGGILSSNGDLTVIRSTVRQNLARYVNGGGISHSGGNLTITGSTINQNSIIDYFGERRGGGVYSVGVATVADSIISGNGVSSDIVGSSYGGGIFSQGELTIINSAISGNNAVGIQGASRGGGIYSAGNLTVAGSTIAGNRAGRASGNAGNSGAGGGIFNRGEMTISNSTISGNEAEFRAGGVYHGYGLAVIEHSTITDNHSRSGESGGLLVAGDTFFGTQLAPIEIRSSIIAGNANSDATYRVGSPQSTANPFQSRGYNIIGTGNYDSAFNQPGDQTGVLDPMLGPLAENGGPTMTHALLPGSPAIDAGNPAAMAGVGDVPELDQRGGPWLRVAGGRIDTGAVEAQPNPLPGDGNFDGVVDDDDHDVWSAGFGSNNDLRGDFNNDGSVDAADYVVWRKNLGQSLAAASAGSGSSMFPIALSGDQAASSDERDSLPATVQNLLAAPAKIRFDQATFRPAPATANHAVNHEDALMAWLIPREIDKRDPDDEMLASQWIGMQPATQNATGTISRMYADESRESGFHDAVDEAIAAWSLATSVAL